MQNMQRTILGFVTGGVAFALLFVAWVYPEVPTASYTLAALLVVLLGAMVFMNQRALKEALKTRSLRYGTNAAVTIGLVLAILIVLNFLNFQHFVRKDLTKDKAYSLSDQTVRILKDLKQDVQITVFVKGPERDAIKGLIDNYLYHTKKIAVEYVDPDRDPARTKALNVKKYGTVIVQSGKRDSRVDEANEEKLTNALMKVLKDKSVTACLTIGHGERGIESAEPEGYNQLKKEFGSQNYEAKNINLLEEGKIADDCSVVLILGPTKAFFDKEMTLLQGWIDSGGRALIALDPNIKSATGDNLEMKKLLDDWFIKVNHDLVLDPTSRLLGVNASVPLVGMYNKDHPITKDFQAASLFALASSAEIKNGAPASLKTWWLARSTPKAFSKKDFKEIATGRVTLDEKKDIPGPHTMAIALEGSRTADKKASRPTRLVVMTTSKVATNQWINHGGNLDMFLNSVSWLADDENLISIRPKDEGMVVPSLTQTEARYIQLLTMILIPGGVLLLGLVVWLRRRKL